MKNGSEETDNAADGQNPMDVPQEDDDHLKQHTDELQMQLGMCVCVSSSSRFCLSGIAQQTSVTTNECDTQLQPTGSIFHSHLPMCCLMNVHAAGTRKRKKSHPTGKFANKVQAVIVERQQWATSMFVTQKHKCQFITHHPQV